MDKKLCIFILGNNPAEAELEAYELKKNGLVFSSNIIDTKKAFLEALDESMPDLILADYDLPSFDGLAALRIAKEKCPDVPFILVAGKVGEEFAIETLKKGVTDYVMKGNLKRLTHSVKRALEEAKLIKERRNIQGEIVKMKERLSFILTTAPVAIYTSKASGDYETTFISGGIQGLLGYKPDVFTSNASFWADNIHPHDRERVLQGLSKILIHGYHIHEYRFRHADGTYHWMHDESKLIYDNNGTPLETIGCWIDITERKRSEEVLWQNEQRLNAMLKSIGDHMSMLDKDLNIIWTNDIAKKYFGNYIVGRKCYEVFHRRKEPCEPYPCLTLKTFQDGKIHEHDTQVIHKDGKILYFHCTANVALRDEEGKPTAVIEISRDITDRKRAEEDLFQYRKHLEDMVKERTAELEKTNKELQHEITERKRYEEQLRTSSEQLRSLSAHLQSIREEERKHLAREIHDELGQVLTVLKMEIRSLLDGLSTEQNKVILNTESITQLINSAIDIVGKVCLELRPAIVDELGLSAAIEWLAQEIEKRSNIKCKITFEPQEIIVDKKHSMALFRISQELLNNVVRHAQANIIKINLKRRKNRIIMSIKDNGTGITDEQISHPGSLGLIGMRERIQFLGGSFAIRGVKDKGTTATISIPLNQSEI